MNKNYNKSTEHISTEDKETIGLKSIIIDYLHHWKLFLGVFIFSLVPAIIYLIIYPTTYEIVAKVQLQEEKGLGSNSLGMGEAGGLMKSFGLGSLPSGSINIDDELVKLTSNELVKEMVLKLGINVNYIKPNAYKYYMYENVPVVLFADSATNATLSSAITFELSIDKNEKVEIKTISNDGTDKFNFASLPAEIKLKEGTFNIAYKEKPNLPYAIEMEMSPAHWVADDLIELLTIEEYTKTSNIIEFSYLDYERKRGVDMLTTLINLYNEKENSIKKQEGKKSIDFLDQRIESVLRSLTDVEYNIESYKTKNKITDIVLDVQFYGEQIKELQVKIIELEAQANIINIMNDYVKDPKNEYNIVPSLFTASEGDKASPVTAYNDALIERARVMQSTEKNNPLLNNINRQLEHLRKSVFLSIENASRSTNMALADLKSKEKALLSKMGIVPSIERMYLDFKREQEISQAVYILLLQKREEIALSIGEDKQKARIVEPAYVKQRPVAPRKLFAALGMIALTLIIPVGYLFVKKQILDLIAEYYKSKQKK